ncbi:succinyl-diaminopimelate desuccinylase [Geodermatophilus sp. DSM 45219]|uniref:succinyl-diaminopimelate desuccinylase n=1 Tax=Geodermatophilus sp. DSM 45219 TaxID=1881103 RepID=UPI00088F630A|nr:succinyl-diaminopimelate desuccinylase [Geodermatophilus sp. DSM 45219]SDN40177.1 succinyldiaminopimelate desuccinylase [Geodermatophilus sp. DSM 45219]
MSDLPPLDPAADVLTLTRALVDAPSVSGSEAALADAVEAALRALGGLEVERVGDAVLARTNLGLPTRVVLAGHLDTVPIADNVPSRLDETTGRLYGCGTSDMKAGDAVVLRLAGRFGVPGARPAHDLTFVFYDNEEVEAVKNGLGRVARERRGWLYGDLAILLEPTDGEIEAGCQGTLRARLETTGRRAHSARSWLGVNAVHGLAGALATLAAYRPREVEIDGCRYREGLNAVGISGGVAGNVIPDEAALTVNFRYAPDRDEDAAEAHVREVFADAVAAGATLTVTDNAGGALPGLSEPAAAAFVAAVGRPARAKLGWTDVARFAAFGIPAVNYGPGDPQLAHTREEHVLVERLQPAEDALVAYLTTPTSQEPA